MKSNEVTLNTLKATAIKIGLESEDLDVIDFIINAIDPSGNKMSRLLYELLVRSHNKGFRKGVNVTKDEIKNIK